MENLCKIYGIKINLIMVFYWETNRYSKIANQKMKRYFYTFDNY